MQKRLVVIAGLLAAFFFTSCTLKKSGYDLRSPDGHVRVNFYVTEDGMAFYNVILEDSVIIRYSRLGLVRDDGDFSTDLTIAGVSWNEPVEETYDLAVGKKLHCVYKVNRRILSLKNASGQKMDGVNITTNSIILAQTVIELFI